MVLMSAKYTPPASLIEKAAAAVAQFGDTASKKLRSGIGQEEDQLRSPLEILLKNMADALGVDLVPIGEASLSSLGVRPDYAIEVAGAQVGYLELKAPGRGVPGVWTPNKHEREQWAKLKLLPNVMYTDGSLWAVYRDGEMVGSVARLEGNLKRAGKKLKPADGEFIRVLSDFLLWAPTPPRTIKQLVKAVANLCRLLRSEVLDAIGREKNGKDSEKIFTELADDWGKLLFPGLSGEKFADAYAQTVTFALLLARVEGIDFEGRHLSSIARQLGKKHSLMGKALSVLTADTVESSVVVRTLIRVIGVVNWDDVSDGSADSYLHLYEHFLEIYDPELRKDSGSYYTPNEVVSFMVRFTEEILRDRLSKPRGFANEDVTIVDPAMGTGTFLLNIIDAVAQAIITEEGPGAVAPQLRSLFGRLIGFEMQTGPYAVAELRVHQALKAQYQAKIPEKEVRFYVADTLDDPYVEQADVMSGYGPIARSRNEANKVKREAPVMVVIGNPPYSDRAKSAGGWIDPPGKKDKNKRVPLDDFRSHDLGKHAFNLASMYVYFWRWATWKVFDAHPEQPSGIVTFVTPSSYIAGAGFAQMREYLRRSADEGWIIDLSPEQHQPDVSTRIFPKVQQNLCIGIFVRYGPADSDTPARIHHLAVTGHRNEKFARLTSVTLDDPDWVDCGIGWRDALTPAASDQWQSYPALGDLLPWALTGMTSNRNWVQAPDQATLIRRWSRLIDATLEEKSVLMKETGDRTLHSLPGALPGGENSELPLAAEYRKNPRIEPVALRSFDRQKVILDPRVVDRARPILWGIRGERQIYATEQHAHPITAGPALVFASLVPNVHHFNGRGGRVLPLYRDASGLMPNVAPELLKAIGDRLGKLVTADELMAYIAGITSHPAYTARFIEELKNPGVRVPLTADLELWNETIRVGREVLWLHTYGERNADPAEGRPIGPPRTTPSERPKVMVTIPDTVEAMPEEISYDSATRTLHVGAGQISPVSPQVWEYEVSGWKVVRRWFGYRRKNPGGKKTSPLDDINFDHWTAQYTTELLDLLNVLSRCVALEPKQAELLERICDGPLITVTDLEQMKVLPVPASARKTPTTDTDTIESSVLF